MIAGSAIAACYEGVGISWESYGVQIVSNNIFGAYAAVGTSWGSHDIVVQGNALASSGGDGWPGAAVNLHKPRSIDILDNVVLSGALPSSDPDLDVVVEGNEIR